jgi:hypothetical protein
MSDPSPDLEQELRQLKPIAPSPALDARISSRLSPPTISPFTIPHSQFPRSDRLLLSTLTAAAASLILITSLLTTDYLNTPPAASPAIVQSPNTLTPTNTRLLLAQLTHDQSP